MNNENQEKSLQNKQENEGTLEITKQKEDNLIPVGSYNKGNRTENLTSLEKEQIKGRSGLTVEYPPIINTSKEEALAAKMKNIREPGFTNYWEQMEDKLTPKFLITGFYPKYLSFNQLQNHNGINKNKNQNLLGKEEGKGQGEGEEGEGQGEGEEGEGQGEGEEGEGGEGQGEGEGGEGQGEGGEGEGEEKKN